MENLELAKWKLKGLLPPGEWVPVTVVYAALRPCGLRKTVLKRARYEIGAQSKKFDGIQYWRLP